MVYVFKQNLVAKDKYGIKCPYGMKAEYVTVHDTANSAPATNEIQYMITNNHEVSFHVAVDEKEAIQGLPFDRNSWSCGDGGHGTGNRKGISVEICRPTHTDKSLYTQAEENAVYVVARLLYANGLSIERLKKHQDWSGKMCPNVILSSNAWESFKSRVEWVLQAIKRGECLDTLDSGSTSLVSANVSTESMAYQVGDKVRVKESATQYVTGENMAWFVKGSIYEVTRIEKDRVLLADIVSWVYIDDVEKVAVETSGESQVPFLVEIICDELNIREKADFSSKVVGVVTRGEVFTITEECNGLGRLKSGAGYISMHEKYVKKL